MMSERTQERDLNVNAHTVVVNLEEKVDYVSEFQPSMDLCALLCFNQAIGR